MASDTFSHLHQSVVHVMALSDQERIAFLDEPRWIGYSRAKEIITLLKGLMEMPKRPRMPNLLIVGDSNNGKTTLIRHFTATYGGEIENQSPEPIKPIVLAEAPTSADEKGLYISILERFWAPYRPTDPVSKLRYQVIHLMRSCQVRILVIDEMHSLLTGTASKQREVMNALKLLCNELNIPIVGVGIREAVRVLHLDPQHASRFDVAALSRWENDIEFLKLLASFEKVLPLKKSSNLKAPEPAQKIHLISDGNIGNMHRLLIECAKEAIVSGKEKIDTEIIDKKKWIRPTKGLREIFS